MSILSGGLVAAVGAIEDILLRQGRSIAGIVPGVVLEEDHTDEMMITQHPVEKGASITDHAVKQPAQLMMRCGWSASGGAIPLIGTASPRDTYNTLLALQASRQPFDVVTGKRSYKNMLIRRLSVVTDIESENCLLVDVEMQEVIIVDTTPQSGSTDVGSLQQVASQAANGSVVDNGTVQGHDVTGMNSDAQLAAAGVVFGP